MITFKQYITENYAFQRGKVTVSYHENDDDRGGHYTVHHNGKEISKHPFTDFTKNAAPAFEAAKKHAITSHVADVNADDKKREHDYQHNKPLTDLEKRWVVLHKKLKNAVKTKEYMSDDELKKYSSYGEVVRKSLRDGTHKALHEERTHSAKGAVIETSVFGVKAYHGRCLEAGCKWESKRSSNIKQAQKYIKDHHQKEHLLHD